MRNIVARLAIETFYCSGLAHAIGFRYGGFGSIFMFHSVVSDPKVHLYAPIHTSITFLEAWLQSLRRFRIDIVSLDEALRRIHGQDYRRFVVLTFDDGYADNLVHALPLLEKYQAPFTVYVTTQMVTGELYCWWISLERLFYRNDAVEVPPMERRFITTSIKEKMDAHKAVSDWVHKDIETRAFLLRDVLLRYSIPVDSREGGVGLSYKQLRLLGENPLVTIGGHTTTHRELSKLNEADAKKEILDNKIFLENVLDMAVDHFAYPFGSREHCGQREAALASEIGFKSAVTTRHGCLFPQHVDNIHLLPRCAASGDREWLSFMHVQRHGFFRFIRSRVGDPVVTV